MDLILDVLKAAEDVSEREGGMREELRRGESRQRGVFKVRVALKSGKTRDLLLDGAGRRGAVLARKRAEELG